MPEHVDAVESIGSDSKSNGTETAVSASTDDSALNSQRRIGRHELVDVHPDDDMAGRRSRRTACRST